VKPYELTAILAGLAVGIWLVRRPGSTPAPARALLLASIAAVLASLFVGLWLFVVGVMLFLASLAALYVSARRSRGT
jgi:hypothetical protein